MSLDDSQEEDCTVYIEQLKSDNATLKLNAASKIPVIAAVLGHNRIRDELIPYIIEIIQQMDNDNDFLIKVSEGLLQLKSFCVNNKQLSILIHPLKILASLDQPAVRDKAIFCLKKLVESQNKSFYEEYYFPLIQNLAENKLSYSPRVVAANLIPVTYQFVSQKQQDDLRKIFKKLALQQNSPLVRRALAENIEAFKAVVPKNIIRSDLLEIWQSFILDPIDIIRIKALQSAHFVASAFKTEQTNDKFLKLIKQVDPNKKSWRIRYSLAECLANLMHKFDKDIIRKEVLECFEDLLKDVEPEVRAIALLKTPILAEKLSKQQSFTALFQYFEKASKDGTKDTPPTVKLALVESIIPYFKTIENQKITQNGIPILASLLKDQNLMVRVNIVQNISDLHAVIGKQNTLKYLIPMLQSVLTDKKWRFKLAVAENIEKLFKSLGYDDFKDFFDKILGIYMKDHNFSVREQTIKCLVGLSSTFRAETELEVVSKFVNQLIGEVNYIYRCTALMLLQKAALGNAIDKKSINDLFVGVTQKMGQKGEKVANVLIYYFDMYGKIKSHLTSQSKKEYSIFSRKVQESVSDEDVQFYIQKAEQ